MLRRRIIFALLIVGVLSISTVSTRAQSSGRKAWTRGATDYSIQGTTAPNAEAQVASQESNKTALVGSWLLNLAIGNKVVASYTSDGIAMGSSQGDVSLSLPTGTPQHGAWIYVGDNQFAITLLSVGYDLATAEGRGLVKINLLVKVNKNGDQLNGMAKVQIFDPDGNPVDNFSFPLEGTRIKAERFN
jgi:hypothetical protein